MKRIILLFCGTLLLASGAGATPDPAPAQIVYGVQPTYDWQVYAGYAFVRFYEVPKTTVDLNGFEFSISYYIPNHDWIGAEGSLLGAFGSQLGNTATLALGMGGGRVRWTGPRGIEVWAHALAGGAHFTPQTPFGSQGALAFEAGGGVDLNPRHSRLALRVGADMVGTRFFSTYQYSPKISGGVVIKF